MDLNGKVIVVTGASRGLGLSISCELASKGANLALVDLDFAELTTAVQSCRALVDRAKCYSANVSDEQSIVNLFDKVIADFGRIDGCVNNAGITRDGLLVKVKNGKVTHKMEMKDWQSVIDVDLTGVFLCAREAAAKMIECGAPGVIINISSISRAGNYGQTNYSAAKAGVAAMTVTWAKELARYNIRVAAIAPGFANTTMVANMKPESLKKVEASIPLKRLAEPSEIALATSFLFENDYFTGRVLDLDGGLRL